MKSSHQSREATLPATYGSEIPWTEKHDQEVLALVMRLMRVPGVSCEEQEIAHEIRAILIEAGVPAEHIHQDEAHRQSPYGGRCGNLIVNLPGACAQPRRLLSAHMDTVAVHLGADPVREGDRIVDANGGGVATDNRSGVAIVLYAALRLLRENLPHPPLTLLFTVQEEIGSQGARYADLDCFGRPEMGFTWDGQDLSAIALAGKGKTNMEIEILGKEAKFFGPQQGGISTPLIFARAVADLDTNGWLGKPVVKDGKQAASNITIIEGSAHGYETNVVMDRLLVRAEAREYDSPGFNREVAQAFREAFEHAAARTVNGAGACGRIEFRITSERESCRLPEDAPVVREAVRALESVGIGNPRFRDGCLDIGALIPRGCPSVNLGTGGVGAHNRGNYLNIPVFLKACRTALWLAPNQTPKEEMNHAEASKAS